MRLATFASVIFLSLACGRGYHPPLWCVPGQKIRHLATNKEGTVREMRGQQVVVDFDDGELVCEPIKVVPISVRNVDR